jgi:hypothetical protein
LEFLKALGLEQDVLDTVDRLPERSEERVSGSDEIVPDAGGILDACDP